MFLPDVLEAMGLRANRKLADSNVVAAGLFLTGASERTERERELPDDCCGLVVRASGLRESEGK